MYATFEKKLSLHAKHLNARLSIHGYRYNRRASQNKGKIIKINK